MAEPKHPVPPRFFTAHEKFGGPLPAERLLYLELQSWSVRTREAVYRIVLAREGAEVWLGEVEGYAGRPEVNVAAAAAPIDAVLHGDTFTVTLDGTPKVVQLELRRPLEGTATPYRLIITGATPQSVRYQTVRLAEEYAPFVRMSLNGDGRLYLDPMGELVLRIDGGAPRAVEGAPNAAVLLLPDATNRVIERGES